jgi:hypothetical protein
VAFLGRPATVQQYKLSRKHAFVALANLSDAFGRMLSEPQRQQKKVTEMHQFVVSNHMLTSYIATLAYYMDPLAMKHANPALQPVVDDITLRLESSVDILEERTREGAAEIPEGYERDGPWRSRPNEVLSGSSVRKDGQVSQEAGASGESGPRPAEAGGPLQSRSIGVTRGGALAAELQPVADQFGFIAKVTSDIRKLSVSLRKALP